MSKVIKLRSKKSGVRLSATGVRGMRAAVQSSGSFDPASRTFEYTLATERPCRTHRVSEDGMSLVDVDEILPMAALVEIETAATCPILESHNYYDLRSRVGRNTSARVEGDKLVCTGQLSPRAEIDWIAADIAGGFIDSTSVGYDVLEDGEPVQRPGQVPLVTVKSWRVSEASLVNVPADITAKIRSARRSKRATPASTGNRAMTPEELKALLTETFTSVTDTLVTALTEDDGEGAGDDLEAEAEAAAEEARAAVLAKRSKSTTPAPATTGARSAQDKATVLALRTACGKRGLAADFDVLEKSGASIAELRGVLSAGLRTANADISGGQSVPAPKRGKLIGFAETSVGKKAAK